MNGKRWHTKEDVLKDLSEATGRRVKDLDEDDLIVGQKPPPRYVSHEDDEIRLQHQWQLSDKVQKDDVAAPDLKGITQMLRMVKEHDDSSYDDNVAQGKSFKPSQNDNGIIFISKLNPNTKEFIPNGARVNNCNTANGTHINKECARSNGTTNAHVEREIGGSFNKINKHNELKIENPKNSNEIDDMAAILKNKICDAAKSNTFQVKKEKNVAMANLLKLYSKSPDSKSTHSKQKKHTKKALKLYTPQYFENCRARVDLNCDVVTEQPNDENECDEEESSLTPNIDESLKLEETKVNTLVNDTIAEPISVSNPEIQNSIKKVDKWLNHEINVSKPKVPAIFLGPVAFKRKESTAKRMSPTEIVDKKISKPGEYKPTKYAEELGQKYMERNNAKAPPNMNIWTKLENDLKEKDFIIKNQLKDQSKNDHNGSQAITEEDA